MDNRYESSLAIFCLYAPDGVVRFRVKYILDELTTVVDEIIIVSNGDINEEGRNILCNYTDNLIIRENIGFDGGAYADVIIHHLGREKLRQYSMLVLCNDTFWGPFVSLLDIFTKMKNSNADYWGLNKVDAGFLSYLQSYFLVFRRKVIKSDTLYNFFAERNKYYNTRRIYDIYIYFELALYSYMIDKELSSDIYTFAHNSCVYESPAHCYIRYKLPILKCKALTDEYYHPEQIAILLDELKKTSDYPIEEIKKEISEVYNIRIEEGYSIVDLPPEETPTTVPDYSADDFIQFSCSFDHTYLYGSGLLGQKICYTIGGKLHNLCGFLVSDDRDIIEKTVMGLPVIHYSDRERNCCMIMALDRIHSQQVFDNLGNDGSMMYLKQEYNIKNEEV